MKIRIAQFGLGPIGLETLKLAATKSWVEVVGAVDIDPAKAGKDLAELTGLKSLRGAMVHASTETLLAGGKPEVIFHTAVSRFKLAYSQLEPIARQGIHVVSSCEELVFPQLREPILARKLDRVAKRSGAVLVGTGVNPGFVMDVLPLCLSSVNRSVKAIHIERVVNASTRREPLQRKIGSGQDPKAFRKKLKAGEAGHAGLKESLALIAHTLGWKVRGIGEEADAVVADHDIQTAFLSVKKGQVCGIHQRAEAKLGSRICLTLDLKMYLDARDPHDAIRIDGDPPLDLVLSGGVAGDSATVAALVNTAPRVLEAKPGLRLLPELPLAHFYPQ